MTTPQYPTATNRAALIVDIAIGAGVSIWTLVQAVIRIVEIVPNRDVPVAASFADTLATMPIGPGGSDVEVVAQQIVLYASDMPPITVASLILAQALYAVTVVVTIVCVCLVIRNIVRGETFGRANVGLVGTATFVFAIGWLLTLLFTTMGSNGAASALAGIPADNTPAQVDYLVIFAIASLGALSLAFVNGNRLKTETEGLV